jgi:hypothetical protein
MGLSLLLDPITGDAVRDADGQVVYTDAPTSELFLALGVPLGSFPADPEQGSELPDAVGGAQAVTPDVLIPRARAALQRLERSGRVTVRDIRLEGAQMVIDSDELAAPFSLVVSD